MGEGVLVPVDFCWYSTEITPSEAIRELSTSTSPNTFRLGWSNTSVQSVQPLALDADTIRPNGMMRYALSERSNTIRVRPVAFGVVGTSRLVQVPSELRTRWKTWPQRARSAA